MTVVVLGDVMADVVAVVAGRLARGSDTPARVRFGGGGQGANTAAWLGALGAPVALVGRVGDDVAGREALAALTALGVDVRAVTVDDVRPTGCCVVVVEPDGERTMLPDPGANDAPASLPDGLLRAGDHLHVAGYALLRSGASPGALAALDAARAVGATTSLDPSSAALLDHGSFSGLRFDLVRANRDELRALTGADDPRALLALAREVVVTLGADGAVWTDGAREERVPAEPSQVVDTTGAGDAFVAGLLAARADGAGARAALAAGCGAAALAVARLGGRPGEGPPRAWAPAPRPVRRP